MWPDRAGGFSHMVTKGSQRLTATSVINIPDEGVFFFAEFSTARRRKCIAVNVWSCLCKSMLLD
jgi:hypothetical protein